MKLKKGTVVVDGRIEEYEIGSGNVFADLDLPDAEELQLKSSLISEIGKLMKERRLTQTQLAALPDLDQPRVSRLLRGHLDEFSVEKLLSIVNRLGHRVEVKISERVCAPAEARTVVWIG